MTESSSLCPRYHQAVELLGRRWAGAIIRLLLSGPARYNELRARIPDISDRMLAERNGSPARTQRASQKLR